MLLLEAALLEAMLLEVVLLKAGLLEAVLLDTALLKAALLEAALLEVALLEAPLLISKGESESGPHKEALSLLMKTSTAYSTNLLRKIHVFNNQSHLLVGYVIKHSCKIFIIQKNSPMVSTNLIFIV